MSAESYQDSFLRIRGNLTKWLSGISGGAHLVTGHEINTAELERLRRTLPAGAVIAAAADNRYALSGFAGARYFGQTNASSGMPQDAAQPALFTREALVETALNAGFDMADIHMYYPYPDMELPLVIYSDRYLPKKGELTNNYRNFGTDRLYIFDEAAKWDEIIEDKRFPDFANSFLMVLTVPDKVSSDSVVTGKSAGIGGSTDNLPVFVKYSNDRDDKYCICTQIYDCGANIKKADNASGKGSTNVAFGKYVVKSPMTDAAKGHVANLIDSAKKLTARYEGFADKYGISVFVNKCRLEKDCAVFEYLEQESLESRLLSLMAQGQRELLCKYVRSFADMVRYNADFGIWDIDLIFKNIFVNERADEWTIIDHEWTWEIHDKEDNIFGVNAGNKEIADYIIQRAVYYFIADNPGKGLEKLDLFSITQTTEPKLPHKCYQEDDAFERAFQRQVMGGHCPLSVIYGRTHGKIYDVGQLVNEERRREYQNSVAVEGAAFTDKHVGESHELTIDMRGRNEVIVYPAHCCCFVYLRGASQKCKITTNGIKITKRLYAFTDTNPMMTFKLTGGSGAAKSGSSGGSSTPGAPDTLRINLYVSSQGCNDSPVFEAVIKALSWKRLLM